MAARRRSTAAATIHSLRPISSFRIPNSYFLIREGLGPSRYDSFRTDTEPILEDFFSFAESEEFAHPRDELTEETEYVRTAIKRELAGHVWGDKERYRILINSDQSVWKAADLVPQASLLAQGVIPSEFPEWADREQH